MKKKVRAVTPPDHIKSAPIDKFIKKSLEFGTEIVEISDVLIVIFTY